MSEYQYYEFLAIDRPLTETEMDRLRAVSSRGQITPSSFVNEYHWGDLKADPSDWMRRYFDAHVYIANWRTAILMLRLPKVSLTRKQILAFAREPVLRVAATPTHWVITWASGSGKLR